MSRVDWGDESQKLRERELVVEGRECSCRDCSKTGKVVEWLLSAKVAER